MKRVVLSMLGVLAVAAMPALAQSGSTTGTTSGDMNGMAMDTTNGTPTTTTTTTTTGTTYDNGTTTGTTTTDTTSGTTTTTGTATPPTGYTSGQPRSVNGVPVQEERTNPAVPTHTEDSGLTATGKIVSWNNSELVLSTATGLTHFKLVPETVGAGGTFQEGQVASVDFTRNEQGVLIAKQVRLGDVAAAPPQGITTTGSTAAGANVGTAVDQATTINDSNSNTGTTVDTSTSTTNTTTSTGATSMPATASDSPLIALLGLAALGAAATLRRL